MYPLEFDTPAAAYPADTDLFLSVPPVILLLFLLLLLLAVACGWYGRERMGPRQHDPCEAIYDAVRKAAEDALKASRDDVRGKARRLVDVLDRRLGGVLILAHGVDTPWTEIKTLLDPGDDGDDGHDHPPHPEKADRERPDLVVVNNGHMTVHAAPGEADHKPGGGHGAHEPKSPQLDPRDEVARLRAALHAFADHWRDKPRRLVELRRARANLC
ncbi:hypothetical protein [Brevundimonas sp.]|uniref:hypothetical protein n=1 Tax=Brevundimonas sp. TaxID=1871086 RepID=UPI00391CAE07